MDEQIERFGGTAYTSLQFGYRVTWDAPWSPISDTSDADDLTQVIEAMGWQLRLQRSQKLRRVLGQILERGA